VIRTLASTEKPLFSRATMSAAAAASRSRASRNHRITQRRTRSVSAAKSAAVTGRAGRNVGGASKPASAAAGTKTPSVTHAWRCTWWLSAEPKRWRVRCRRAAGGTHSACWRPRRRLGAVRAGRHEPGCAPLAGQPGRWAVDCGDAMTAAYSQVWLGVARAASPVARCGHPALRSLEGNLASPSWLRSVFASCQTRFGR
jgi:hypothetical protein